jgi:CBS domain containing-hemolysin-like protein
MSQIILLILLILLSGFFSAVEIAFFSLTEVKIKQLLEEKKKGAKIVEKLKKNPQKLLTTILIGNNVVNVWSSALAAVLAVQFFGAIGTGLAVGVMTFLILVFGEITPKSIATIHNQKIALLSALPLLYLSYLLTPLILIFDLLHKLIDKIFKNKEVSDTEEDLKTMAEIGVEKGEVERGEQEMIERVFEFNDITAQDVMTVRSKMVAWKATDPITEALNYLINCPHNRIPVYEDKLDNIIGIVYMKDILKVVANNNTDILLKDIAHKPFFIPPSKIIDDLLKDFQRQRLHIAIVVNEHGIVEGLVTMEDLLEELVGEIIDETDVEEQLIKRIDKKTIIVDGSIDVEEINDFFNVDLKAPKNHTVAWLILDQLGEIPEKGKAVIFDSVKLIVEEADEKKIKKVRIIK